MALSKPEMGLLKPGMDRFRPGMDPSGPRMDPFRPGTGPLRLTKSFFFCLFFLIWAPWKNSGPNPRSFLFWVGGILGPLGAWPPNENPATAPAGAWVNIEPVGGGNDKHPHYDLRNRVS